MTRLRRLTRLILRAAAQAPSRCLRTVQNLPSRHDPISFERIRDRLPLSLRGPAPSRVLLPPRLPLSSHLLSDSARAHRPTPLHPLARPFLTKVDHLRRHITGNPTTVTHRRITSPRHSQRRCRRLTRPTCRRHIHRRGIKTTILRAQANTRHRPPSRRCRIIPHCQSRGRRGTLRPTRNLHGHSRTGTIPTRWPRPISPRQANT